jgi:DNA-binding MarR family transcriptional regulator
MSKRIASSAIQVVEQTERDIRARLKGGHLDFTAMSAVSNIYRAGTSVRNHMERTVLADNELSWIAFTVLWVLWIWGEQETGHVASEAGVTKGTLTGVVRTLQGRKLLIRTSQKDDRRRVNIRLSKAGEKLIAKIFPLFNREEHAVITCLSTAEQRELARLLRKINAHMHEGDL